MKFHKNKFLTTVSAIALVLAVGACSSSSDDEGNSMLQTDLDAAIAKAAALQVDLDEANADLAQANLDLAKARNDLLMAMDNTDDEEEIVRLKQAVTDAERMRDDYKKDLDAANVKLEMVQADLDAVDKLVMLKKTRGLLAVLAPMPERDDNANDAIVSASVKDGAVVFSVTVGEKFVPKAGASAPDLNDASWAGGLLEHPDEDTKSETVTVYTNIDQPTMKPFGDVYTDTVMLAEAVDSKAKSGRFPPKGEEQEYDNTDPAEGVKLAGTYDGVDGNFLHAGPGTITADAKGRPMFATGWTFKPGSTGSMVTVQDKDYLHFGWWIDTPAKADADGGYTYGFNPFAGGSQSFVAENLLAVTGSATYKGKAAGMYALENDFQGTGDYGSFTANAALTADFDTAGEMGTIKGSITDFMAKGAPVDWKVTLRGAFVESTGKYAATTPILGAVTGTTSATLGAATGKGMWNAAFFGTGRNDDQPGSVAGEFDATFGDSARLEGAFGATNRDTDTSAN